MTNHPNNYVCKGCSICYYSRVVIERHQKETGHKGIFYATQKQMEEMVTGQLLERLPTLDESLNKNEVTI